jgi:MFS family permease
MTTAPAPTPTLEPDGTDEPRLLVKGSLKRLLGWIIPANLSIFILWGAIPGVLLPLQVAGIDEANKVANLAVITTVGAFAAMIAQPVAGMISDRTRSRFGRRAPWMVAGVLIGGLALVGMALANGLMQIAIAWTIVQIAYNFAQGPLSAILPDRVPHAARSPAPAPCSVRSVARSPARPCGRTSPRPTCCSRASRSW